MTFLRSFYQWECQDSERRIDLPKASQLKNGWTWKMIPGALPPRPVFTPGTSCLSRTQGPVTLPSTALLTPYLLLRAASTSSSSLAERSCSVSSGLCLLLASGFQAVVGGPHLHGLQEALGQLSASCFLLSLWWLWTAWKLCFHPPPVGHSCFLSKGVEVHCPLLTSLQTCVLYQLGLLPSCLTAPPRLTHHLRGSWRPGRLLLWSHFCPLAQIDPPLLWALPPNYKRLLQNIKKRQIMQKENDQGESLWNQSLKSLCSQSSQISGSESSPQSESGLYLTGDGDFNNWLLKYWFPQLKMSIIILPIWSAG